MYAGALSLTILNASRLNVRPPSGPVEGVEDGGDVDTSAGRFVRYQFTPAFLKLCTVGAT